MTSSLAPHRRVVVGSDTTGPSTPCWGADTLLVLDAHGVVLNRAFPTFVRRRAEERGDDLRAVWRRWRHDLRLDCWEGRISAEQTWARLFPGDAPATLEEGLSRTYARGPIFDRVVASGQRAWLLSNHRTDWLRPQLRRFGLDDRFERVIVSDDIGVAKPNHHVFRDICRRAGAGRVVLLDDSERNVAAAREAGLEAYQVVDPHRWIGADPLEELR